MLQAKNISYKYPRGKDWVLRNFSADFQKNHITAITGPNGCGKTTLSKILVGICKPQRGNVYLDDVDIGGLSLAEVGEKIGLVMQNPNRQIFCTSVWDEVTYGLKNQQLPTAEIEQRVVLAAVLAMKPQYLLLDEPTASLDVYRQRLLGEQLQRVRQELRCGIIIISHDKRFIEKFTETQVRMEVAAK